MTTPSNEQSLDGLVERPVWVPHVHKDGARFHVLWWDSNGRHCSCRNCEINRLSVLKDN